MTTNDEKDLMRVDDRTQERVIESLVLRGSVGARAEGPRAVLRRCARGLGSTRVQPLRSLRLNGRTPPDARCDRSTARIHCVNREIIDGPKVIDLAGTKLVYAKRKHPRWPHGDRSRHGAAGRSGQRC